MIVSPVETPIQTPHTSPEASFSADLKPWEKRVTSAIIVESGAVMARDLNSFFKLSGKLDLPA